MPPGKDLFATTCEAVVIPTNCVGTQGAGVAKLAARRWPQWSRDHTAYCRKTKPAPGSLRCFEYVPMRGPRWTLALATKGDWREPSRLEWVASGLTKLDAAVSLAGIPSLAIPALGCGVRTGQLSWTDVRPLILATAERLSARGVRVEVYEPHIETLPRSTARRTTR
jgi:hypothetical protein